ncbi:MAG: hypothetical protein NUV48_07180 [Peptococcaceae bacterium]|nr:hypothetical protein [Peptococcaceae bacterium]
MARWWPPSQNLLRIPGRHRLAVAFRVTNTPFHSPVSSPPYSGCRSRTCADHQEKIVSHGPSRRPLGSGTIVLVEAPLFLTAGFSGRLVSRLAPGTYVRLRKNLEKDKNLRGESEVLMG